MHADMTRDDRAPAASSSGESGSPPEALSLIRRIGLSNVRIGRKIGLGFAVVLALTIGVSFLGWNGLREVGAEFEKTDAVVLLADRFVEIRNDQKNFQIGGEERDFESARQKIGPLREQADGLEALFRSVDGRELIDRLKAEIDRYETQLNLYHDLEGKKKAALGRMLVRASEMEAVADELRLAQNLRYKQMAEELARLELQRERRMAIATESANVVGLMSDGLVEVQKFQLTGNAAHADKFKSLSQKAAMSLGDLKVMLGEEDAGQLPDDVFTMMKSLDAGFAKMAEFLTAGDKSQAQNAAMAVEKTTQGIKDILRVLAAGQTAEFDFIASDTQSAKEDMDARQLITQDAGRLIETVWKIRLSQQHYVSRPASEAADDVRYWAGGIKDVVGSLATRLTESEDKAAIQKIGESADGYLAEFENVVAFTTEQAEADQAMADSSRALNARIAQATADQKAAMTDQRDSSGLLAIIGSAVALVLGVIFAFFISRSITAPLSYITDNMLRLAEGDTSIEIRNRSLRNEIGALSRAMGVFLEKTLEMGRMREKQEENERRAEKEKRAAMVKMADQFEASVGEVVERVSSAATEMQASSEAMGATAEETTRQASAVAAASEQASANVETVASAAEELSSSISEISRQVTQASQIASAAVTEAEQANVKVQGLAQAANKIGEVVALITDIAEQTNLLALNATIEAARAGDAGKGFAVVASEVKNLANQTAKATDEIGAQISGIQAATQEAVSAIESITKTISKINEVNSGVASAVEEQGAATQEIARNVEQASAGTQEVSANISGVSVAANETGTAAEQIHKAAGELSRQSETLRAEVDKFLANVRTA
ncbi:methyl-accepting chemotaxis protein [Shumkonia mesophila]|uniref:methyl-accepting chemotaxis protein n=1 Tax=Shumkonia mesophila TaxID=2838854 RepID=UPI0029340FE9|nr:methyl-accepting chemotaxis protein [Shumkonia mesophila]